MRSPAVPAVPPSAPTRPALPHAPRAARALLVAAALFAAPAIGAVVLDGGVASAQPRGPAQAGGAARRGGAPGGQARGRRPADGAEGELPAPTLADLASILPGLQSPNTDEVRAALDLLTVLDSPEVVAPIAALLRSGQPDVVTDRAIEALGQIAEPAAVDVLVEMTRHRREGARRRAYQALAQIRDPRVPRLVEQGLRDSDRNVRGAAALALGELGARDSVELLFHAFDRGVIEAAVAIGKLGDARAVRRFSELLGRHPLSVMLSGFEQFVRRRDLPDDVKLEIVGKLGEVSGPMVKQFLREYFATFPERDRSALKRAVEETIRRIPDAPRSAPPSSTGAPQGGAS